MNGEFKFQSEIENQIETIRATAYRMGVEAGIDLGRTISEFAETKGISFEEARKELGIEK